MKGAVPFGIVLYHYTGIFEVFMAKLFFDGEAARLDHNVSFGSLIW